ncbi:MAG: formylmethanofuran dehydrogenase subunit C [Candidatus Geothermarchaeales archaeon]
MKEVVLKVKEVLKTPIEAPEISPDLLAGKSNEEIRKIKVWEGNRRIELGGIFEVEGDAEANSNELTVRIVGDASKVHKVGCGMKGGSIVVEGSIGMYLGYEMSGGNITVNGDAGSWVGSKMRDGVIEVRGSAGDLIGAPYRGSRRGMAGGLIVVHGDVGAEAGCWMRGGTIRVRGSSGMFPGLHMSKGTVLIEGDCEGRAGAEMIGGKVIVMGHTPSVLPSFSIEGKRGKTKAAGEKIAGPFYVFVGDNNEGGSGRLFVNIDKNPHLGWCEKYLE